MVARHKVVTVANSAKNLGLTVLDSGDTKLLDLQRHVPDEARAVLLNVTVSEPDHDTRLTFWRAGRAMPATVDMSAQKGRSVTASFVVPLSRAQRIDLHNAGADGVGVVIRLAGYLA
jgi:hypothetical protein